MIEVGFCELHDGIFVGGKNLTAKLDTQRTAGLKMLYDKKEKELLVTWNGVESHVVSTNIKHYIPGPAADRKILQTASPQISNIASTAQVETPFGHVHAGPGAGKSGVSKGVK